MNHKDISMEKELAVQIWQDDILSDHHPRFYYELQHYGQGAFLSRRCEQEGIAHRCEKGKIRIFSKNKAIILSRIVEESLQYCELPFPEFTKDSTAFWEGKALICTLLRNENEVQAYIVEDKLPEYMFHLYKREVPKPDHFFIYSKKYEMIKVLNEKCLCEV